MIRSKQGFTPKIREIFIKNYIKLNSKNTWSEKIDVTWLKMTLRFLSFIAENILAGQTYFDIIGQI